MGASAESRFSRDEETVYRTLEKAGGLATFNKLAQRMTGKLSREELNLTLSRLETFGRVTTLMGPNMTLFYASEGMMEEAR